MSSKFKKGIVVKGGISESSDVSAESNNYICDILSYGADPTGVADSTTAIQDACDDAYTHHGKVIGTGTFLISDTITLRSAADLSGATFNIADDDTDAIEFLDARTDDSLWTKTVRFPSVVCTAAHTAGAWGTGAGITVTNAVCCSFYVPYAYRFGIGLLFKTSGAYGNVYNSVYINRIDSCKVGLELLPASNGWVNDNIFFGGEIAVWSGDGTGVASHYAIYLADGLYAPDGNVFDKIGMEGNTWQYNVKLYGSANIFRYCRWEGDAPKVNLEKWNSGTSFCAYNEFIGSYGSLITFSSVDQWNIFLSKIDGPTYTVLGHYGTAPQLNMINVQGDTYPCISLWSGDWDGDIAGVEWKVRAGANGIDLKDTNDTYDRLNLSSSDGKISMGSGSGAVDTAIERGGVGILKITVPPTYADNTAAKAGGLTAGMLYRTSAGALMVTHD